MCNVHLRWSCTILSSTKEVICRLQKHTSVHFRPHGETYICSAIQIPNHLHHLPTTTHTQTTSGSSKSCSAQTVHIRFSDTYFIFPPVPGIRANTASNALSRCGCLRSTVRARFRTWWRTCLKTNGTHCLEQAGRSLSSSVNCFATLVNNTAQHVPSSSRMFISYHTHKIMQVHLCESNMSSNHVYAQNQFQARTLHVTISNIWLAATCGFETPRSVSAAEHT